MSPDNKNKGKSKSAPVTAPEKITKFLNPYNFVLTPDRSKQLKNPDLGDHDPSDPAQKEDHSRYWSGRYSGQITVRLKTKTPLFITDPRSKTPYRVADHYLYGTLDYIPATALKGVISSVYETITNSRYRVFDDIIHPAAPTKPKNQKPDIPLKNFTHASLRKATVLNECSPGERLLGWINKEGSGAWKGKVRFTDGRCVSADSPVHKFAKPIPLAILGKPRPETARFYLGNAQGNRQAHGIDEEGVDYRRLTSPAKRIRGRKVFLHHQLTCANPDKVLPSRKGKPYWSETNEKGTFYKQFIMRSDKGLESDQNRSINSWISPNMEFKFKLYVENLTEFELGALLCLFALDKDCYFRIGLGKPLGLGSVSLSIDTEETSLHDNAALADAYRSFAEDASEKLTDFESLKKAYRDKVVEAYGGKIGGSWENISFIKGLLFSMRGSLPGTVATAPVIYPQTQLDEPEESFRWFNLNEKVTGSSRGKRYCLPDPNMDTGDFIYLPLQPADKQNAGNRGGYGGYRGGRGNYNRSGYRRY